MQQNTYDKKKKKAGKNASWTNYQISIEGAWVPESNMYYLTRLFSWQNKTSKANTWTIIYRWK